MEVLRQFKRLDQMGQLGAAEGLQRRNSDVAPDAIEACSSRPR